MYPKFLFILIFCFIWSMATPGRAAPSGKEDSVHSGRLALVIAAESAIYLGGLYYLNNVWYKDHEPVPFHFYNDAAGWLQMDKVGHAYAAYYQGYFGMKALEWANVSEDKAMWYGGALGILLQTPIEIFDGLYEGYGFSIPDMIANLSGTALLIGQEAAWKEQRILMKFSYSPTSYPQYRPSFFGRTVAGNFFTDYNGHTYWLSANLRKLAPGANLPKWLNVAVGMSGDGMLGEFENPDSYRGEPLPEFERSRQWFLSVDIDLREIPVKGSFFRSLFDALNMLKFPAPALEFHAAKGIRFHPVYF